MKGNIAIIAAMRGEVLPLVTHATARSWKRIPSAAGVDMWEYLHANGRWIAACAGMGGHRAAIAFAAARERAPIDAVCSIGWAGALNGELRAGDVCSPSTVVDVATGESFRTSHWTKSTPVLASTLQVADVGVKRRIAEQYHAGLVDMEAATIARIAAEMSLPFYCTKAISDEANAQLPDINPFIGLDGQLRMAPFLLHVSLRPASWMGLYRLGCHSRSAAINLAKAIYDWLDERWYARRANGDIQEQ